MKHLESGTCLIPIHRELTELEESRVVQPEKRRESYKNFMEYSLYVRTLIYFNSCNAVLKEHRLCYLYLQILQVRFRKVSLPGSDAKW